MSHFSTNKTAMNPLETFNVNFAIANHEATDIEDVRVGFYLSQDGNITTDDYLIGFDEIATVGGNSNTGTLNKTLKLPYPAFVTLGKAKLKLNL